MGNIGIDVSKKQLAKECVEWRKSFHEANKMAKRFEDALFTITGMSDATAEQLREYAEDVLSNKLTGV